MKSGIWSVETARLCMSCMDDMAAEYIIQPTKAQRREPHFDTWKPGVCERCGKKKSMTKLRRYTMNRAGLIAHGRENG